MKRIAIVTGILSGVLFGVATPFSKMLLEGLNSFQLAGLLYLGAALAMLPYILRKGSKIKPLFQINSIAKTSGIIFFGGILAPLLLLAGLKSANLFYWPAGHNVKGIQLMFYIINCQVFLAQPISSTYPKTPAILNNTSLTV